MGPRNLGKWDRWDKPEPVRGTTESGTDGTGPLDLDDALWEALVGGERLKRERAEEALREVCARHEQALSDVLAVFEMFAGSSAYDHDIHPRRLQADLRETVRRLRTLDALHRMSER